MGAVAIVFAVIMAIIGIALIVQAFSNSLVFLVASSLFLLWVAAFAVNKYRLYLAHRSYRMPGDSQSKG